MLGIVQARLANYAEATNCFQRTISINPDAFDAYVNLGQCLHIMGAQEKAISTYQQALKINPAHPATLVLTGNSLVQTDRLTEAEDSYKQALIQEPGYLTARGNLANVLAYQGRILEAVEHYRQVLKADPHQHSVHSNLLLCLHYDETYEPEYIFKEHVEWASQHATAIEISTCYSNDPAPCRKLRIGYVSPDLRTHSVACFAEPILRSHDRALFEVYCYVEYGMIDHSAKRLLKLADTVRNTYRMSDDAVADLVRKDRIDLLIDLSGHTENNRLLMFARKPAPVQITSIGYPDTTGLGTIDYRISDERADPSGMTEHLHTEQLLRLKSGFLCFSPPPESPEVSDLPARMNKYITFGSFNIMTKITPDIIKAWAEILSRLPNSRFFIKNRWLTDTVLQERIAAVFVKHGIQHNRVIISGRTTKKEHMAACGKVDIALDTYPYNGTTTTCDALWMGVPVITRSGKTHVSRTGASLLSQIGLDDLVTHTKHQYIDKAVQLALDLPRLGNLRIDLREMMCNSSLCNEKKYIAELEELYRNVWMIWCQSTRTD